MPTLNTVEAFVSLVEAGQGLLAMERFYAEHVAMQENQAEPRAGKAALLEHERRAQAAVRDLSSTCLRPVLVSGDVAVIRWVIEYTHRAGQPVRLEELAYQRWEGERIVHEQFFYDPVQLTGSASQ